MSCSEDGNTKNLTADATDFLFFKMLFLAELLNLSPFLTEKLIHKDADEMFKRARKDHVGLHFHQYQEWIIHDLMKTLNMAQRDEICSNGEEFIVRDIEDEDDNKSLKSISGFSSNTRQSNFRFRSGSMLRSVLSKQFEQKVPQTHYDKDK